MSCRLGRENSSAVCAFNGVVFNLFHRCICCVEIHVIEPSALRAKMGFVFSSLGKQRFSIIRVLDNLRNSSTSPGLQELCSQSHDPSILCEFGVENDRDCWRSANEIDGAMVRFISPKKTSNRLSFFLILGATHREENNQVNEFLKRGSSCGSCICSLSRSYPLRSSRLLSSHYYDGAALPIAGELSKEASVAGRVTRSYLSP